MNKHDLRAIIVEGNAELMVKEAEALGKGLARQLTTSQIRNIFGTVRRIEMNWPASPKTETERKRAQKARRDLLLLKPKMAYQAKRERGKGIQILTEVLSDAIDLVEGEHDRFQNFVDFFEAILAYHKAFGGN